MEATTTCYCGHGVTGAIINGPLTTPHVVCDKCGKECVVLLADERMDTAKAASFVRLPAAVTHKGQSIPCASKSLPTDMREGEVVNRGGHKVRYHAEDGTYSTMDGRPIIDTSEARKKHLARAGFVDWDS